MPNIKYGLIAYAVIMSVSILPLADSDLFAGYKDDIGYTALQDEFGASIESFLAEHWLDRGYLMGGQFLKPLTAKNRVRMRTLLN